jgi:hypothetical protein
VSVDIAIGKRETSAPMFPCTRGYCAGSACRKCLQLVKEECRADAPHITTATAQGMKTGGYNFDGCSNGFYFRWLRETGIAERYPWLNIPTNDPLAFSIPDTMPGYLHRLAVDIEIGKVVTSYPASDAEFTCWMAWWCGAALKSYGLQAAILFS